MNRLQRFLPAFLASGPSDSVHDSDETSEAVVVEVAFSFAQVARSGHFQICHYWEHTKTQICEFHERERTEDK